MATARALSITEIVVEIVEHANMLPERAPVLARLARVNWMFHDHAVKLLWADLPDLEPLFMLLSNCVRVPTRAKVASDMRRIVPLGSHSLVSRQSCPLFGILIGAYTHIEAARVDARRRYRSFLPHRSRRPLS